MKIKLYNYVVLCKKGNYFPTDMLRYNRCWPNGQDASNKVSVTHGTHYSNHKMTPEERAEFNAEKEKIFRIDICGIDPPSEAAWRSFGCTVVDIKSTKVDQ